MTLKRTAYLLFTVLALVMLLAGACRLLPQNNPGAAPAQGELNLYNIDPITLDPAVSGEMTSHEYIVQIFSGLLRLDADLQPASDIARQWQVSPDGRTYTFELRQDVRFHDGRQVKAEDFKYSWERAADPATGSQTAALYLGDIVGVKDKLAGRAGEISGVRAVGDFTLQVTIDAPKSYFLSKMTYPTSFVVDKNNVASGRDWWRRPNGTGPFKLKRWDINSLLVLQRNELYHGQPASVSAVSFHLWSGVPMNLYETGQIDATGISMSYIDRVTDEAGPFYRQLEVTPELSFSYIGFNLTRPPFDDANVRRAFALAIDKDKLAALVFRDMVQPAEGILPPGMPGYNQDLSGPGFDPEKAKALIAASRYGSVSNLPPVTITTSGYGGMISNDLEAIIQEWRQNLGVEVAVRQLEPERFLYNLKQEKDEMFSIGWVADYPHPQNFLEILFHSGTETNYGEYSNPRVDSLLERAGLEQDGARSLALYQQAEQALVDDAASIPLWFGKNYTLVKPYVSGYRLNPMGLASLEKVSVQK